MIEPLLRAENALALGLVDQAQEIYERTLAQDPVNAIAMVGLARVALERSDERGSLELARRAFAMDPENAAAGRMIARLEEVLQARGEEIAPEPGTTGPVPPAHPAPPPAPPEVTSGRRGFLRRLTGRR